MCSCPTQSPTRSLIQASQQPGGAAAVVVVVVVVAVVVVDPGNAEGATDPASRAGIEWWHCESPPCRFSCAPSLGSGPLSSGDTLDGVEFSVCRDGVPVHVPVPVSLGPPPNSGPSLDDAARLAHAFSAIAAGTTPVPRTLPGVIVAAAEAAAAAWGESGDMRA